MTRVKRGQSAAAPHRPWRILVTGDNPDSVELISRLLAEAGHEIDRAEARNEVLAILGTHAPHVLLIDVTHPGQGDALALIEAVRKSTSDSVSSTKVVVCASRGVSALFARDIGADEVLVRPFFAHTLLGTVDEVVAGPKEPAVPVTSQNR